MFIPVPPPTLPVQHISLETVNQPRNGFDSALANNPSLTPQTQIQGKPLAISTPPTSFPPEFSASRVEPSNPLSVASEAVLIPVEAVEWSAESEPMPSQSIPVIAPPTPQDTATQALPVILPQEQPEMAVPLSVEPPLSSESVVVADLNGDGSPLASRIARIIVEDRAGTVREFNVGTPLAQQTTEETPPQVLEVKANRQEFERDRQIVIAEGNVEVRFARGVLSADRVLINLENRLAVAQGNVALRRGEQVLRGDRFEYSFLQDSGVILKASGEIYQPTAGRDFSPTLPADVSATVLPERPLSDRIIAEQPLQRITTDEGLTFVVGGGQNVTGLNVPETGGQINRIRFQAEEVTFDAEGWNARDIRLTNDPFSPPELEIRADTARFRSIGPLQDEITTTNSRVVFDQGLSVPIFQDRLVIDRRPTDPSVISFGFDSEERGGFYAERPFSLINTPQWLFTVTPQYFIQKALFEDGPIDPSVFGVEARLAGTISPRTTVQGAGELNSLDLDEFEDRFRANLRLRHLIGDTTNPYTANVEYSYRDRLFNGSLGFQTVQSSFGAVVTSPVFQLGNTGIFYSYQGAVQRIEADTDRVDLLDPVRENNRVSLTRYQAAASVNRGFSLWQGKPLPPTQTEGLRYTPVPIVPYLRVNAGLTGVGSYYSNGDTQQSISGTVGLQGQFGHFSRPFFDYTGFNIAYTQVIQGDASPFLFDRVVDDRTLSFGLSQQLYGPFKFGFQTTLNLERNEAISTDYFLEYSRRTYNIVLRYNPVVEIGSLSFRVNDFNWIGSPDPFDATGITPVQQGVER